MKPLQWLVLGILGSLLLTSLMAQSRPLTNEELLKQQFVPAVVDTLTNGLPPEVGVVMTIEPQSTFSRWIHQELTRQFLRKKFRVYKTVTPDVNYRIRVNRLKTVIVYRPVSRNWLGRVSRWQRTIEVSGQLEVVSDREEVRLLQPLTWVYADTVRQNPGTLENPELPFTRGTVEDTTRWQRWVEPILISVATITVVTLFFTIRSQQR